MMTLTGQLCALCAVCSLMQMMIGDARAREGLRMIGGLLMLHLVISGAQELGAKLLSADGLLSMYEILIG